MPEYLLTREGGKAYWTVRWDDSNLVLQDPNGEQVIKTKTACAHRVIDLSGVWVDGTIIFVAPTGELQFQQNLTVTAELQTLVDAGLRGDPLYRAEIRERSKAYFFIGGPVGLIAAFLFAAYCWWASWAPDPAPDSWFHVFALLIKLGLLILMAASLLGIGLCVHGLRQWLRIRRMERELTADVPLNSSLRRDKSSLT